MELMRGGDLFDRIVEEMKFMEKDAKEMFKQIVEGVKYCHDNDIVHRDLKPENIMFVYERPNLQIKLSDFGLARDYKGELLTTACGTPGYVAPEVLEGLKYGRGVDYWSVGVILYTTLVGYPPFYDENV